MTSGETENERESLWPAFLLAAALGVVVHLPSLGNELAYDDVALMERLPQVCADLDWRILFVPRGGTYLDHCLEHALWGDWLAGYRLSSILLHVVASCLAVALCFRLTRSRSVSALTGALFAVHPVHVEALACIANRKDVLAAVFAFAAAWLWTWGPSPFRYALLLLLVWGGLVTKEVASIGVVPMLFVYSWLYAEGRGEERRRRLARAAAWLSPILVLLGIGFSIVGGSHQVAEAKGILASESLGSVDSLSVISSTALAYVPEQLRLLGWPVHLSADYRVDPASGFSDPRALAGLGLLLAGVAACTLAARRRRTHAYAGFWMILMFAPVSNLLVPITHFFVQDRYLYVPSFGACLLASLVARDLHLRTRQGPRARRTWLVPAVCVAVLGALGLRSALRVRDWRTDGTLWTSSIESGETTWRALRRYVTVEFEEGRYGEAIRAAHELLPLAPTREIRLVALGIVAESSFRLGDYEEAALHYKAAAQIDPCPDLRLGLAKSLLMRGQREEARGICEEVLARDPGNADARFLLSRASNGD